MPQQPDNREGIADALAAMVDGRVTTPQPQASDAPPPPTAPPGLPPPPLPHRREQPLYTPPPLSPAPHAAALARRIELQRTLIPILLTCGVMFPLSALIMLLSDPDSPLGSVPGAFAALLLIVGVLLLSLGVLNMVLVDRARRRR